MIPKVAIDRVREHCGVTDDDFTQWHDHGDGSGNGLPQGSPYELASAAWEEAVRRILENPDIFVSRMVR